MPYLCADFKSFLEPNLDRATFIQHFLKRIGLSCPVIPIDGKKHLLVSFKKTQYNPLFKIKTVIAHYDRVPNSPGANDNSSSVFSLLKFAERLVNRPGIHNIRMIFSDGEEEAEKGVVSQGAYGLAQLFKKLGLTRDDIFVFDCMGRGTIPVLTETNFSNKVSQSFLKEFNELESRAENLLKGATGGKWIKAPCNLSDNAGFIANGIPAVAITMLPSDEADGLLLFDRRPASWELLHTPNDNFESLEEKSFEITATILDQLANLRTLAKQ